MIDTPSPSIKITGASINSSSTNLHHGHSSQVNLNNHPSLYKHRNSSHKIHTNSSYANNLTNQHTNRRRLSSTSTASAVLVGSAANYINKSSASSSSTSNYNLSSAAGSLPTTPTTPPNLNLINEEKLNVNLLNTNPPVSPTTTAAVVKPTGDLFKRVDESAETEI